MSSVKLLGSALLLAVATPVFAQDTGDTGVTGTTTTDPGPDLDVDDDLDGWTIADGDCEDTLPEVNPGRPEVCEDLLDNNCDGLYNEGCDTRARTARVLGGGGCTGGNGVAKTWLFLPLLLVGVRRRAK